MITDKDVKKLKETFATKEDLKRFATKEDLKISEEETKRHFDVVAEDIKSDFKLLSEQVLTFAEKAAGHEGKIDNLNSDVSLLKGRVSAVETKIVK